MNEHHIERMVEEVERLHDSEWCLEGCLTCGDNPIPTKDAISLWLRTALTSAYNAGLERAKEARATLNILNEESVEDVLSALAAKNAAIEKEKIESSPE